LPAGRPAGVTRELARRESVRAGASAAAGRHMRAPGAPRGMLG
jgi:hypothetical protein